MSKSSTREVEKMGEKAASMEEFEWITLKNEIGSSHHVETSREKMARKIKENPMVPIGCMATLGALSYGLWSFRQGRKEMSQYMMRTRVLAQGFTIIALIVGIGIAAKKGS